MIVSHVHRFVAFLIPKTGSASLRRWLSWYGGESVGGYHDYEVPADAWPGYTRLTMVREPVARCWSMWRFDGSGHSFEDYMERVVGWRDAGRPGGETPRRYATQAGYIRRAEIDVVLRLESAQRDLARLPFTRGRLRLFPHRRRTTSGPTFPGAEGLTARGRAPW